MKDIILDIALAIIFALAIWSCISFVLQEANYEKWTVEQRAFSVMLWIMANFATIGLRRK